jgi:hypothetical protein
MQSKYLPEGKEEPASVPRVLSTEPGTGLEVLEQVTSSLRA